MKEVLAIIRRSKVERTKKALEEIGVCGLTIYSAEGRGKQRGIMAEIDPQMADFEDHLKIRLTPVRYALEHPICRPISFIPKKVLSVVVRDDMKDRTVKAIIATNTSGSVGDGRVYILPVEDCVQIRTGLRKEESL